MLTDILKRRVPTLVSLGFGAERFPRYCNRRVNLHALEVVLLSFILRGRGRHFIEEETFEERGASVAVTHYGQRHDIVTDARGMDVINVYLDLRRVALPVLPPALQAVLPLLLPLHPGFRHRLNRIVRLQFDDPQPATEQLLAILREQEQGEAGYEDAMRMHFKLFLMLCRRQVIKRGFVPQTGGDVPSQMRLEEVRRLLDAHYAEPQTLARLARRAGLSCTYLCRAFKAYTGMPVFDYLIQRRIQAAMMRLRGGNEKILQIALECGFNDLAYFNRKFKALLGQTPSAYRRAPAGPSAVTPWRTAHGHGRGTGAGRGAAGG